MEIYNSMIHGAQGVNGPHRNTFSQPASTAVESTPIRDEVSFSETSRQASGADRSESSSPIRFELVNRIKSDIAAGPYDTADKMDIAMDRLLSRLNPR